MTDFQLGLLLIGVVAIVAVIVFNRVQERAAAKRAELAFGSRHEDVLLAESSRRREPTLEPAVRNAERSEEGASQALLPDPVLDYIVALSSSRELAAASFLEHWVPLEHRFAKRVLAAGREEGGPWKPVAQAVGSAFSAFQVALQLVSRDGVVSEGELIGFRSEVENLAAMLGAAAVAPEMKQAMDHARELDRFCADVDIQIVLNLVSLGDGGFDGAKLESALSAAGLGQLAGGQYALRDASGRILYAVRLIGGERAGELEKLVFSLDVPRVPDVREAYEAMVRFARQLAAGLGGGLIDDNGRPLDEQSLAAIGAELDAVRQALEGRGLASGGSLALRLFS